MTGRSLFHLHLNTPDFAGATERLDREGIPLRRRFGSVRGRSVSLAPDDDAPNAFRPKLRVHQRGAVNVTLAPGRRPRFDHLGLIVESVGTVCGRAERRGWAVRSNERRTFVATPWGFRVELHEATGDVVASLGEPEEARLADVALRLPDADEVRTGFEEVFGPVSDLRIESGDGPWVDSFEIVRRPGTTTVNVGTLLENRRRPAGKYE